MRERDVFLKKAIQSSGLVETAAIERAAIFARKRDISLADALIDTGAMTSTELLAMRADIYEVPFVDLNDFEVCYNNSNRIPRSIAERHCVFPIFELDDVLTVAAPEALPLKAMDQIRQIARREVDLVLTDKINLETLISRAYSLNSSHQPMGIGGNDRVEIKDDNDQASSGPIVGAVNQLLNDAADMGASDIHINPDEKTLHIRYRVDGVLLERQGPSLAMHAGIVQRLKVISNLDLTQTRRPQDGKFRFQHRGSDIEVRLSTLPTVCGENVVMRLLADRQIIGDFKELGLATDIVDDLEQIVTQPYGMLLVTGPTGSGKTTTLYTALNRLNDPSRNLITIEDPVEIRRPYIRQVQVNHEIGMTFATALRSILRQDPDVVLVGEIRDNDTATIALQAAMTGHFVLATLHTNDAAGSVARLRDFGLPPFIINSSILGVLAQRLVRRVCSHCVASMVPEKSLAARFGLQGDIEGFSHGRGCTKCARTGYKGRVGIYEFLKFTRTVQNLITEGRSVDEIRERAVVDGMRLMWQDGLEKARLGLTTLEEIAKATSLVSVDEPGRNKVVRKTISKKNSHKKNQKKAA